MNTLTISSRRGEAGFTLVELAIVMIIIGLLIGGILKGQELIANAQLTATVAQIKGIDGALSTFRDKYSALPGDMRAPDTRLRDCAANPCSRAGNGNGRIDSPGLGDAPTNATEGSVAFAHMAAADLISGVDINSDVSPPVFGALLPEAKIGGGFWLGFTQDGGATGVAGMRPGHYLVMNGLVADVSAASSGLTSTQAAQIDRKLDDGNGSSGDVQATGTSCITAAGVYQESVTTASCALYIRVQG